MGTLCCSYRFYNYSNIRFSNHHNLSTSFSFVLLIAQGEVYTWGWKECVPSGKVISEQTPAGLRPVEKDALLLNDQGE